MYSFKQNDLNIQIPYSVSRSFAQRNNLMRSTAYNTFLNGNIREFTKSEDDLMNNKYIQRLIKDRERTIKNNERIKIDLLLENAYDKYKNNIRNYNFNSLSPNRVVVNKFSGILPPVVKTKIVDSIIEKTNLLFPKKYQNSKVKLFNERKVNALPICEKKNIIDRSKFYKSRYLKSNDNMFGSYKKSNDLISTIQFNNIFKDSQETFKFRNRSGK